MPLEIRTATEDDREPLHELSQRAFSERPRPYNAADDRAAVPLDRRLVAADGNTIIGKLSMWPLGQWFGGYRVPMGGVAGVAVEPEHRGRGVATALLRASLEMMRAHGEALSSLYPMNHTLYRRFGWESGGSYPEHRLPIRALADLPQARRPAHVRRTQPGDLTTLREHYHAVAATEPGNLWYDSTFATRALLDQPGAHDSYVVELDGEVAGVVVLRKDAPRDGSEWYALTIRHLFAIDADAELALWRFLAGYHPVARTVHVVAPMSRLLPHVLGEREVTPAGGGWVWMTRLVDAVAAVEARGYPTHADIEVNLRIDDPVADWNSGAWVLRVHDGKGTLEPGGTASLQLSVGSLATLYTGFADPYLLARWGLIGGASATDLDALRSVFAGPAPWCRDFF